MQPMREYLLRASTIFCQTTNILDFSYLKKKKSFATKYIYIYYNPKFVWTYLDRFVIL